MKEVIKNLKKVSEWIEKGGLSTGYNFIENVIIVKETEKAIAIQKQKYTEFGNLKPALCWLPKSYIIQVENDFYKDSLGDIYFLIPQWLYQKKDEEGYYL